MNDLEKAIVEVLSESEKPMTFDELYRALVRRGVKAGQDEVRETLARLIRSRTVVREADLERRKMVFRAAGKG
ncbi:hypothetical protein [Pyrodictium occultum]|uniref:hypothetical protein n=1 Tax=Pyrodictium occultum TaxID=2309 RepID=UPI0014437F02|nr:hypothetical protein [Pyrodictium occultum]